MAGTGLYAPAGAAVEIAENDESLNALRVKCTTANIPSAVSGYAIGCYLTATDTGIIYINTGSASSCSFAILDSLRSAGIMYGSVVATTTGTNVNTNVFGANGAPANMTITSVTALAQDAIGSTVYLANGTTTLATIISVSTAGSVLASITTSGVSVVSGSALTVSSAGPGNSSMLITFTIP